MSFFIMIAFERPKEEQRTFSSAHIYLKGNINSAKALVSRKLLHRLDTKFFIVWKRQSFQFINLIVVPYMQIRTFWKKVNCFYKALSDQQKIKIKEILYKIELIKFPDRKLDKYINLQRTEILCFNRPI